MRFIPANVASTRPNDVLIWKKQHWADIVMVSDSPVPRNKRTFVWVTPTDGLWYVTDDRFLFKYDLKSITPYLRLLKRLRKEQDESLLQKAISAYSKLDRWARQIAYSAAYRNGLLTPHAHV